MSYSDSDIEPPAWRLPLISFAIQASLRCHLWTFWHAGQRSGIDKSSNESNTIASVVRPVRTGFLNTGQRIKISGMGYHQSREMCVEGQPGNYYVQASGVVCQRPGATAITYELIAARIPVAIIAVLPMPDQSLRRAISLSCWFAGISYSSMACLIALCSSGWSKTMPMNWPGVPRM
jgi:hypothetical protein